MSQPAAVTRTAPRPTARQAAGPDARTAPRAPVRAPAPPRLRVVAAAGHTRSRAGLAAACVVLLVVGLVGLLLLNVSLERGAYDLRDQNSRAEQLREQAQQITQENLRLSAPDALAAQARRLGMVDAAPAPVFVLPDGRTVGVAEKAAPSTSPSVSTRKQQATRGTPAGPTGSAAPTAH